MIQTAKASSLNKTKKERKSFEIKLMLEYYILYSALSIIVIKRKRIRERTTFSD